MLSEEAGSNQAEDSTTPNLDWLKSTEAGASDEQASNETPPDSGSEPSDQVPRESPQTPDQATEIGAARALSEEPTQGPGELSAVEQTLDVAKTQGSADEQALHAEQTQGAPELPAVEQALDAGQTQAPADQPAVEPGGEAQPSEAPEAPEAPEAQPTPVEPPPQVRSGLVPPDSLAGTKGGECVIFVQDQLHTHFPVNHAKEMLNENQHPGYNRVSEPLPGDLFVRSTHSQSKSGHVGFVKEVNGNSITVIDSNFQSDGVVRVHTYPRSEIDGYLRKAP